MRSHSYSIFRPYDVHLLQRAETIVQQLPDELRCHEVARIIGGLLCLEVCDGFYGFVDHSWCWTTPLSTTRPPTRRFGMPNILDPYCVGSLPQVRLVDSSCTSLPHVGWSYRPDTPRTDVDAALVEIWIKKLRTETTSS